MAVLIVLVLVFLVSWDIIVLIDTNYDITDLVARD